MLFNYYKSIGFQRFKFERRKETLDVHMYGKCFRIFFNSHIFYFAPYLGSKCKPTTPLQNLSKLLEVQITLVNYSGCLKWI